MFIASQLSDMKAQYGKDQIHIKDSKIIQGRRYKILSFNM